MTSAAPEALATCVLVHANEVHLKRNRLVDKLRERGVIAKRVVYASADRAVVLGDLGAVDCVVCVIDDLRTDQVRAIADSAGRQQRPLFRCGHQTTGPGWQTLSEFVRSRVRHANKPAAVPSVDAAIDALWSSPDGSTPPGAKYGRTALQVEETERRAAMYAAENDELRAELQRVRDANAATDAATGAKLRQAAEFIEALTAERDDALAKLEAQTKAHKEAAAPADGELRAFLAATASLVASGDLDVSAAWSMVSKRIGGKR